MWSDLIAIPQFGRYCAVMNWKITIMLLLAPVALAGCTSNQTRKAPPVVEEPPRPVEKTWLDQTAESTQHAADATWNVVSAPARWVAPKKKVPTTRPVYDAPDAIIVQSDEDGARPIMVPLAEEPATQPTTKPALKSKLK